MTFLFCFLLNAELQLNHSQYLFLTDKNMVIRLFLLAFLNLVFGQFLPKQLNSLPVNDLFMSDIARSGKTDFWKVDAQYWSTITSAYPVRPNSITKVTFRIVYGREFLIGCGKGQFSDVLRTQYVGQFPNSVGFYTLNGQKYKNGDSIDYSSAAAVAVGDLITMTIDLRPFENTVSFSKNGLPLGIAFAGLNYWGEDVYIFFSIRWPNDRISIVSYEVQE